ncbi:hypothetical protein SUGI_0672880 [Cryptomeria japonica]|nr:hypothetical protein SUGI_0672880 [Cryptomeria japonica]
MIHQPDWIDVDKKEVDEDGIGRRQAVVKCVVIQTLVRRSGGALRSYEGLSAILGLLVRKMLTKILIPFAMVIGIGSTLLQWLLVSHVKVKPSTTSNGYNDGLLKDDSECMSVMK